MQSKNYFACLLALAALGTAGSMAAQTTQQFGDYDFSYVVKGEHRVKPLQVFDNGASTYFQFRAGEPIPLILTAGSAGSVRLTPEIEGPYVRVGGVAREYVLKMGKATVNVTYVGSRLTTPAAKAQSAEMSSTAFAQVVLPGEDANRPPYLTTNRPGVLVRNVQDELLPRIAVDVNSYAIPVKGDVAQFQPQGVEPLVSINPAAQQPSRMVGAGAAAVGKVQEKSLPFVLGVSNPGPQATQLTKKVAAQYKPGSVITVIGYDDSSYKEGLAMGRSNAIAGLLRREGVPAAMIRVTAQGASASQSVANTAGNVVTGAMLVLYAGNGSANALQQQGFVSAQQVTDATLASLADQLKARRITPSHAARQVNELRVQTQARHVQPVAGWQEAQITTWQMRATDFNVQGVLQRWGKEAGWQVVWKNGPDIKVLSDSEPLIRDGFVAASDYVMAYARSMGYRVKGRAYQNRVLVITDN